MVSFNDLVSAILLLLTFAFEPPPEVGFTKKKKQICLLKCPFGLLKCPKCSDSLLLKILAGKSCSLSVLKYFYFEISYFLISKFHMLLKKYELVLSVTE